MKKFFASILIICIIICFGSCGQKTNLPASKPRIDVVAVYDDVNVDDWYKDAVDWGVNDNIMPASKPDLFGAATPITKAQVILAMWKAAGAPGQVISPKALPDSDPKSDISIAMNWALDNKIIEKIDQYASSAKITRLEAIKYMWNEASNPITSGINFEDTKEEASVLWAKTKNITLGIGHNLFGPDMDCTKAHMITFLYRAK